MNLPQPMYDPVPFSPVTTISAAITAVDTTVTVSDGAVLGSAPNIAVIGDSADTAETIIYGAKNGNTLSSVQRGVQGTSNSWSVGVHISRNFTALDLSNIQANIIAIGNELNFSSGTWTPIAGNGFTLAVESAFYQRFSSLVYIQAHIHIAKSAGASYDATYVFVHGAPFNSLNNPGMFYPLGVSYAGFADVKGWLLYYGTGSMALTSQNGGYFTVGMLPASGSYQIILGGVYPI